MGKVEKTRKKTERRNKGNRKRKGRRDKTHMRPDGYILLESIKLNERLFFQLSLLITLFTFHLLSFIFIRFSSLCSQFLSFS